MQYLLELNARLTEELTETADEFGVPHSAIGELYRLTVAINNAGLDADAAFKVADAWAGEYRRMHIEDVVPAAEGWGIAPPAHSP